jgi:hypothetical protein
MKKKDNQSKVKEPGVVAEFREAVQEVKKCRQALSKAEKRAKKLKLKIENMGMAPQVFATTNVRKRFCSGPSCKFPLGATPA